MPSPRRTVRLAAFALLLLACVPPPSAVAQDGDKEAAEEGVYVVNADGSGLTALLESPPDELPFVREPPTWSPDGTKLLFTAVGVRPPDAPDAPAGQRRQIADFGIHVVNADGSGLTNLGVEGFEPAWSPDGTKIAFSAYPSPDDAFRDVYVVDADGSGMARVASTPMDQFIVAWSPDGTQIAFTRYVPYQD